MCAAPDHTKDTCTSTTFSCPNCRGHPAFSKQCRFYAFHFQVLQLQTEESYTLREARQQARRLGFITTTTYSQRLRTTPTSNSAVISPAPHPSDSTAPLLFLFTQLLLLLFPLPSPCQTLSPSLIPALPSHLLPVRLSRDRQNLSESVTLHKRVQTTRLPRASTHPKKLLPALLRNLPAAPPGAESQEVKPTSVTQPTPTPSTVLLQTLFLWRPVKMPVWTVRRSRPPWTVLVHLLTFLPPIRKPPARLLVTFTRLVPIPPLSPVNTLPTLRPTL